MTVLLLTNDTVGAPALHGTNGRLNAVLDWALPQKSWAIEFSAANASVYRAASGNRHRLSVRHDSAVSGASSAAVVRGCEAASSAILLTDPFPTVAQFADTLALWLASELVTTAVRNYKVLVSETWFILMVKHGTLDQWDTQFFGDVPKTHAEDTWNTICTTRGTAGVAFSIGLGNETMNHVLSPGARIFWVRGIDGSSKSTRGGLTSTGTAIAGAHSGFPIARSGYGNRVVREKMAVYDSGNPNVAASPLGIAKRGWLPNLWNILHSGLGGMTSSDTHTDTPYAPGSLFRVIPTFTSGAFLLEETDTWTPPLG
jgi:hypothetical protein